MPITQASKSALVASAQKGVDDAQAFLALVNALPADAPVADQPPPAPVNTYIDRAHPGTLITTVNGTQLKWTVSSRPDVDGMTPFFANGSTSTTIYGKRLVLQGPDVFALQNGGEWLVGDLWGKHLQAVLPVVDPVAG